MSQRNYQGRGRLTKEPSALDASNIESENFLLKTVEDRENSRLKKEIMEAKMVCIELKEVLAMRTNFKISEACKAIIDFTAEQNQDDPLLNKSSDNPFVEDKSCCNII